MSDEVQALDRLQQEIYDKGNSHNPEYWHVAGEIEEYKEELEKGESEQKLIEQAKRKLDGAEFGVEEEAPETVIAVLTGESDGTCNGCGEYKVMNQSGYCFMCDYKND